MTILLSLTLALIAGLISTRLVKLIHLPNVTGYLVVGIFLGPYFWKLFNLPGATIISEEMLNSFGIIIDIALGFIAFSIGSEFKLSSLKKLGKRITIITALQSTLALLLVDAALIIICAITGDLQEQLPLILILGAVATATAPAATLMVVKQYKAHGPLTDTLLPVVALDDAFGLIFFAISFSLAQTFAKGTAITIVSILLMPLLEIVLSLAVGAIAGYLLSLCMKFFKSRANRLSLMIAATLLGVALCEIANAQFGLEMSSLLTCMMIGAMFCNTNNDAIKILDGCERWTPPVYLLFFVLSGAGLDFSVMGSSIVLGIGAIYLIARSVGKYFGARLGCQITKTEGPVKKYLGLTLLPQAGVAIGMAHSAANSLQGYGNISSQLTAVVLCATLVYELIGPVITKLALEKAGEIDITPAIQPANQN